MKLFAIVFILVIAFFEITPQPARAQKKFTLLSTSPKQGQRPKALIVIAFDQMRGDYPARFSAAWGDRGFNRLIREGAYFPNCYFNHASNITAPGHAVHLTGCYPHKTGIVSNDYYDRRAARELYCVQDTLHKTFGMTNPKEWHSPANLKMPTLGTYLKQRSPRSKVIGVSQKDRAAILMSGHDANGAYWFEADAGGFTTSDYYTKEFPTWLGEWNKAHPMSAYADKTWSALFTEKTFGVEDSLDFEAMPKGQFVFPYQLPPADSAKQLATRFLLSPFAVEHVFQFAKAVFEREEIGGDDVTDVFCLSISSTDYIGHQFGPQSRELAELYVHVDRYLGEFLDFLDAKLGHEGYALAITSDHGVAPVPEFVKRTQGDTADAGRIKSLELVEALETELTKIFPAAASTAKVAKWISHVELPSIFFTPEALQAIPRLALLDSTRAVLMRCSGVGLVLTDEDLKRKRRPVYCPRETFNLVLNDYFPQRTGELMLYPKKNWIFSSITATHGTPHDYDRHVPMIFLNAGIKSGIHAMRVAPSDIAPTLARLLGITMNNVDGTPIR